MIRPIALVALLSSLFACQEGGFGTRDDTETGLVDADDDGFFSNEDCNDLDADVYPGAPELCDDGRITDCDRIEIGEVNVVTVRDEGFDDLQEALNFANADDEVVICPGTYVGTFITPVAVHMRGIAGPYETILSADGAKLPGTTLLVRSGSKLEGLTIRDGSAEFGGGVVIAEAKNANLEIDTCVITENSAFDGGGLYMPVGATVTAKATSFDRNVAFGSGGGVFLEAGALLRMETGSKLELNTARTGGGAALLDARIEGGEITGNNAVDTAVPDNVQTLRAVRSPGGSGIVAEGRCTVEATQIASNRSEGVAGGAVMALPKSELTLNNVGVANNVTNDGGGGLEIRNGTIQMLGSSQVFGNDSLSDKGSGALLEGGRLTGGVIRDHKSGGGILVNDGEIANIEVSNNENAHEGGGIEAKGVVTLTNVDVFDNKAATGGGIYYQRESSGGAQKLTLIGCSVRRNRAEIGGGIFGESVSMSGGTVSQNQASRGGGMYIVRQLVLEQTTVYENKGQIGGQPVGGGIFYEPRSGDGYPGLPIHVVGASFGAPFGPTDNEPNDVTFVSLEGPQSYDYGENVTFDCLAPSGCATVGGP